MSMVGEIENTKQAITRLQLALADPRVATDDRMRMVIDLAWERQHLEQLERARLKGYKK
jgi:hypothetical protein